LKNSETPEFFAQASKLLTAWNGKTVDDAQKMKVDGVSGATYSSRGILVMCSEDCNMQQKTQ
jgi:uncharacterized protein with FMN-binding domain